MLSNKDETFTDFAPPPSVTDKVEPDKAIDELYSFVESLSLFTAPPDGSVTAFPPEMVKVLPLRDRDCESVLSL